VRGVVALPLAPLLVIAALRARRDSAGRRARGERPRLIWGPEPVISIKFWSAALRARGYESHTCVHGRHSINERSDFDLYYDEFLPAGLVFDPLRAYLVFLHALATADVYIAFFDGGFLRGTALRRAELPLLRLAGKRVVVSPYGSDIAVPGHLGVAQERLLIDYPEIAERAPRVRRRVLSFSRWADVIIRNMQYGFLPRWDVLWPTQFAIDTDLWTAAPLPPGERDGHRCEVVVVHAPNHRSIKGTAELIQAVEELRADGLRVRLDVLERRPNAEVRAAIAASDLVAEQFIAGYGQFGLEGMVSGRPVLAALSWMAADLRRHFEAIGLPIVDTDLGSIKENLRTLIEDPARRATLGAAGRRFAVANHSLDATGEMWDGIVEHVWSGSPLPRAPGARGVEHPAHGPAMSSGA
jgi:glycosyltransferase involved in cell wall biosynthesis